MGGERVDVTALSKTLLEHKVQSLTKPLCTYKEEITFFLVQIIIA